MTTKPNEKAKVTRGSGNVFADLGLDDAEELLAKSKLAQMIRKVIADREMTQAEAGKSLGTSQTEISRLMRGELDRFSMERLIQLLMRCERDIDLVVKRRPVSRKQSRLSVRAA